MIALSNRYSSALLIVLGLALLPVLGEAVRTRSHDDCRHPDMLTLTLAIPGSTPQRRSERLDAEKNTNRREGVLQWTQGNVANPADPDAPLRFWIVRSFDPGRASPRWVLEGAFDPESNELRRVDTEAGPLPVHVAIDRTRQPTRVIAWAWVYGGAPTERVFPALVRNAPARLLRGATPLTLLMVDGHTHGGGAGAVGDVATEWLANAWTHMARHCR
ncbi:MAG: hypothetical protein ABFS41_14350 [Myxococcota bacterium]